MPMVSVIIPAYNAEKHIEETLHSVFSQTFRDLEIIVINDGSSDGTEEILSRYQTQIVYLANQNRGPAYSRNRGLEVARGSLIAFLDADDLWVPTKLEKQVAVAQSHPQYGIITCDAAVFDETGTLAASSKARQPICNGFALDKLLLSNWIGTSCAMVRQECFQKVGTFDEEPFVWGEDWIMWLRIAAEYPVYFVDEVLVRYRVHSQSYGHVTAEKHFLDLWYNLNKLEKAVPELVRRPQLLRAARVALCWRSAWDHLQNLRITEAKEKLQRALHCDRYSLKAWLLISVTYLPPAVLRAMKRGLKAARRRITSWQMRSNLLGRRQRDAYQVRG